MPTRRLYRLLRGIQPVRDDFRSHAARGRRLRPDASDEQRRIFDGLSMYESEVQARETAARFPNVWQTIAVLDLPDDGRFRMEQTGVAAGHWTVWAQPDAVIHYVVDTLPLLKEGAS